VGYWNLAILTPKGIVRRLLELKEETPITVEVPMDGLAPHRVRHEGIIIIAEHGRLTVATETPTIENLEQARQIAIKAIENLPETPLSAVGFNIRFKLDDPPDELLKATATVLANLLSDESLTIKTRKIRYSFEHGAGLVNLDIKQSDNTETTIEFNFHQQSSIPIELVEWLKISCEDVKDLCSTILKTVTGLEFEEAWQ